MAGEKTPRDRAQAIHFGVIIGLMHRSKQHRYSINSSAVERSDGVTAMPSAFAALSDDRQLETATFTVSDSFSFCFFLLRFSGL